jgi:F0F1-type ATP synthase membrane subunit c/vacuolar-type H+-ATPase subunit K
MEAWTKKLSKRSVWNSDFHKQIEARLMISAEDRKALENQHRTLLLVWAAFLATLVIYILLPQFISYAEFLPQSDPFSDVPRMSLWAVVVLVVGILWWWNQRHLTKEALFKNYQPRRGTPLSNYAMKKIVAFALAEAIAIYGLILALMGRHLWDQLALSVIAALFLIYLYPSPAMFNELIREAESRDAS